MPNTCAKRTGTLWLLSALAVGMVAAGCGKEASPGGGGGAGGSINPARNDAGGGRGGAGGSSSGSGGASTGTGGTTGGSGTPGTGGSGAGGSGAGGSAGDAGPAANYNPPPGQAVAKFCNELAGENNMILEFQLEVGADAGVQAAPVKLVARSGECFPPAPQKCASIPVGPVTLRVIDTADMSQVLAIPGMIPDASQMLFLATIDQMTQRPVFRGGPIPAEFNCAVLSPDTSPPPDGGAPGPGPVRPPLMP